MRPVLTRQFGIDTSTTSTSSLQEVSIRDSPVAQCPQLLRRITVVRALRHLSFALTVDPLIVKDENEQRDDTSSDEAKLKSMSEDVSWRVFRPVEVGGHGCKCQNICNAWDLLLGRTYHQQDYRLRSEWPGLWHVSWIRQDLGVQLDLAHNITAKKYSLLLSQVILPGKAGYSAQAAMNTPA